MVHKACGVRKEVSYQLKTWHQSGKNYTLSANINFCTVLLSSKISKIHIIQSWMCQQQLIIMKNCLAHNWINHPGIDDKK